MGIFENFNEFGNQVVFTSCGSHLEVSGAWCLDDGLAAQLVVWREEMAEERAQQAQLLQWNAEVQKQVPGRTARPGSLKRSLLRFRPMFAPRKTPRKGV